MKDDFEELDDDQLYENYDAYKALVEAGIPKKDALKKTGLTAQIVKDLEEEESEEDYKSEFKDAWDQDDDVDDWNEDELEEEAHWEDVSDDYENYDDYDNERDY